MAAGLQPPDATPPADHPDVETMDEIRRLLDRYAAEHHEALTDDMRRYGDPRQAPGFKPERRQRKLERILNRRNELMRYDEEAGNLERRLRELQELAAEIAAGKSRRIRGQATRLHNAYRKLLHPV